MTAPDIRTAILAMDTLAAFDLLTDIMEDVQAQADDIDRTAMSVQVGSTWVEPFDVMDAARAAMTVQREDYPQDYDEGHAAVRDEAARDYLESVL